MLKSALIFSTDVVPEAMGVLLSRARQDGDSQSLADLLEFYRPMLVRLSQRRVSRQLNGKVSPSEVTQVAIISASQNFDDFRGDTVEQFRSWLCVILENAITDQTRRFLASCRDTTRETALPIDIQQNDMERPSQICSTREQVLRLLRVVEEMPVELRTVVRMHYQQDLPFTEIAEFLGLTPAKVRKRWILAVEHITRAMA